MKYTSVRRWLEEHTLIEPSLLNGAGVEAMVADRISATGRGEAGYIVELARSSEEVDRLIAEIAVPETWLFRYPRSYDLLLQFFERRLTEGAARLRAISVGCATGQEPYCIAMTALKAGWPMDRISIEGFDRNRDFLRVAAAGVYGASSIRTELPVWAVSYLRQSGDRVEIDPTVRAMVRFTRADVAELGAAALSGVGPCDVIFCRNLLIYLNSAARERLIDALRAELAPGGLVFVGHAEQLMRGSASLRPVDAPHAFALEVAEPREALPVPVVTVPSPTVRPLISASRAGAPPARPSSAPPRPAPVQPAEDSIEDARDLADAGRARDAEEMIRRIIVRRGPSAAAMELLGIIRLSLNDSPGAKRYFEQAVYLDPARSASLLQLALISERAGETVRATAYWDRARRATSRADQEKRS